MIRVRLAKWPVGTGRGKRRDVGSPGVSFGLVCARAVTLLEMVLATGLLVILMSMTYWFYSAALGARERETQMAENMRLARIILERMGNEIRQASLITNDERVGIRGEPERIWLSTLRVPRRELVGDDYDETHPPPAEFDLVKIEYKVARHPEIQHEDGYDLPLGLARVEHRIPRPDSAQTGEAFEEGALGTPGEPVELSIEEELLFGDETGEPTVEEDINWEELYADDIKFLRFCYFDGHQWWDDWEVSGENPLPQLVKITIGFEPHAPLDAEFGTVEREVEEFCTCMNREPSNCPRLPADQFTHVVRVSQADPFFRSRITREAQELARQVEGESEEKGGSAEEGVR